MDQWWIISGLLWTIGELLWVHCWTVLDSWVFSSVDFQLELFVSLPCSEGLEWDGAWKTLLVIWKLGKKEDSRESSYLECEMLVAEAYPAGGSAYGSDTGTGMTLGD